MIYRLILITEDGLKAILTEAGELLVIDEKRLIEGGGGGGVVPGPSPRLRPKSVKPRPAWRPSMPIIPRVDEEEEALLLCGAI